MTKAELVILVSRIMNAEGSEEELDQLLALLKRTYRIPKLPISFFIRSGK